MELGQHQLQLLVSLVLILGAAFVALICDFLKGNNEQLRELTLELKVRRDEERKRARLLTPSKPAEAPVAQPAAVAPPAREVAAEKPAKRAERKRAVNSEALAAMERGAMLASTGGRPRQAAATVEPPSEFTPVEVVAQAPAASGIKKDWSSILSRKAPARAEQAANADLLSQVVAATAGPSAEAVLPSGFQDGFVLSNLVKSRQPVSGLVVSIGVNGPRTSEGALPDSVHQLVQSLIGPNDFAAQSANDEFLLIYPEERGASAQRRLSQIAQQLWDFQLRSLGSIQILFSWGGVEVRSESIEEAIASASERMQETKRGRKLLTMPAQAQAGDAQLRQAV